MFYYTTVGQFMINYNYYKLIIHKNKSTTYIKSLKDNLIIAQTTGEHLQ